MKKQEFIRVEKLAFQPGHRIRLTFSDGNTHVLDFTPFLTVGEMVEPLRDEQFFAQAALKRNGRAIEWPNGYDASADWLYDLPVVDKYQKVSHMVASNPKSRFAKASELTQSELLVLFEKLSKTEKEEFLKSVLQRYPDFLKAS